jgi:predicted PurR-regulated permease PerM
MEDKDFTRPIFYILLFLAVIVVGTLCKVLSSVVIPIVLAVFLALTFIPVVQKINKKFKIPWVLTVLLIDILLLAAIAAISTLLFNSLSTITSEYPKYESRFMSIYRLIADTFNLEFDAGKSFGENVWNILKVRELVQRIAIFLSSGLVSFSKSLLVIFLLFTFLLIELRVGVKKINTAFADKAKGKIFRISQQIVTETVRFLSIKFFISLATGILVGIGTSIIHLDFPIVWGFIAFIMNFIPTFGSIISTLITTIFALLQFYPSWGKVIYIFVLMLSVNMVLGNIIEPRTEGKHLGLSPFVILVSLSIFGWIWGFAGMIIAVPMTVIIKIICENVSFLHGIAVLLGNTAEPPKKRTPKHFEHKEEAPQQADTQQTDNP